MIVHQSILVLGAALAVTSGAAQSAADTGLTAPMKASADKPAPEYFPPAEAVSVVEFWREAGPALWFAKNNDFDRRFRERFQLLYEAAARGELRGWLATAEGSLALLVLLDQFPRNAFRGTPRMYATDTLAREVANAAINAGHDRMVEREIRKFFYLPFGHSEDLADQERSVALARHLGQPDLAHAEGHRDIIRRFGRFPHRNPILGRRMTKEEQKFLDDGGFAG
jgi:uncharacterized protein (DUF924 family)